MVKFHISWSEEQPTRQQSMYMTLPILKKASWTLYENISRESYFKCFTRLSNCPPLEHPHEYDNASWLTASSMKAVVSNTNLVPFEKEEKKLTKRAG